ncbi:LRRN4 C-terminal-like protein [Xenopus tropicalis]|uniref:LOC100127825 protein n=1 Tax=Xenopus tropicalis TaxID=8364 RepID=A9JTQ7_XENTR|nr:LRRN4 C-terminal-like protein [Xenopus tropicalis]AAI55438.1 LOC100127825 protein [Xenopus tropicalis]|eukprot:NP_001106604.1 LRRN4 C-terminal-like protein [Xenopus tropicalis]
MVVCGPTSPSENGTQSLETSSRIFVGNDSVNLTTTAPVLTTNQSTRSLIPEVTGNRQSTREHLLYVTDDGWDDYYWDSPDNFDEKSTTKPPPAPQTPCPYDRCKHLEPECEEIQRKAGGNCLCPGLNGPTIAPDSPRIAEVIPGDKEISVAWCSPMSTVHGYRVLYGAPDSLLERGPILNNTYRLYAIENLLPGTSYRVCVVAFNGAGESPVNGGEVEEDDGWETGTLGPCRVLHTSSSSKSHIYLGIGVGLAILAVLGLAVLGYFLWKRKKGNMKVFGGEEMGIRNQSYRAESMDKL